MAFISKVLSLIIAAVTALCGFLFPPNVEVPQVAEGQVRILSFNVRYGGDGLRSEKSRAPLVIQTLRDAKPDSSGLQEALKDWMEDLTEGLPEYGWVGVGRDDGQEAGEFNPVFYRKDKYDLVDSGTFWLSETPELPSLGWNGGCNRLCTWAILREKATGFTYAHVNTHLDNASEEARVNGAKLVREKILSFDMPVVCTGDFNVNEGSTVYNLMNDGFIGDSKYLAPDTMASGTYHDYFPIFMSKKSPIDYIFVTKATVAPQVYRVLNHRVNGRFASDHYAIYADVVMK